MSSIYLAIILWMNGKVRKYGKRIAENNHRSDLLSLENARLYEENALYREKLRNLGFTEDKLKNNLQ